MKRSKKKHKKTALNLTLVQRKELNNYIGHPGPASTIAAHRRRAEEAKKAKK